MSTELESATALESPSLLFRTARPRPSLNLSPRTATPAQFALATEVLLRNLGSGAKRFGAVLAFLALWELAPRLNLVEPSLVPPVSEVFQAWWKLLASGELVTHLGASLLRSLVGLTLATLFALPLGLVIGWSKQVAESTHTLLELFRNTAALALLPVFILFLGIGEASKIALVTFSCSWPILLNTISGVRNADPLLIKSARTMGVEGLQLFRKVILPASLPSIFVGFRLSAAISVLALIAAEMIGAKAGLGYLIQYAQYSFMIPQMYAGILTISILGLSLNATLSGFERRLTRWQPTSRR